MPTAIKLEVRDQDASGILISLSDLLDRMDLAEVSFWRTREVDLGGGFLVGTTVLEFEAMTRNDRGHVMSHDELLQLARADVQVLDGTFEAFSSSGRLLFTLLCFDSTLWEISVEPEHSALAFQLISRGAIRC